MNRGVLRLSVCLILTVGLLASARIALAQPAPGPAGPTASRVQTAEEGALVKECDSLCAEANRLLSVGKLDEAIRVVEKLLALERRLAHGDEAVVATLRLLAELQTQREDFPAARSAWREVAALLTARVGEENWQVADARRELAGLDLLERLDRPARDALKQAQALEQRARRLRSVHDQALAVEVIRKALELRCKVLPTIHASVAADFDYLRLLFQEMGDHAQARQCSDLALKISRKVFPAADPRLADRLRSAAMLLWSQGDLARARAHLEEALAINRKVLPADHPDLARALDALGWLLKEQEDLVRVEKHLNEALTLCRTALPEGHPGLRGCVTHLTALLPDHGDYAPARQYLEEALARRRKNLPAGHPEIADSLHHLGLLFRDRGDHARARQSLDEALVLRRKALPAGHPETAALLVDLGEMAREEGNPVQARKDLDPALTALRLGTSARPDLIARCQFNRGLVLHCLGDAASARNALEASLQAWPYCLPKEHPAVVRSLQGLGLVLLDLGDETAARRNLQAAVDLSRKSLPARHPLTAASLAGLGHVLRCLGEHAPARQCLEEALGARRKAHPPGHPDIAASLHGLGLVLLTEGDAVQAGRRLEEAVALYRQAPPHHRSELAAALNDQGRLLLDQGDQARARRSLEEALAIRRQALPAGHPHLVDSHASLGLLGWAAGEPAEAEAHFQTMLLLRQNHLGAALAALTEREQFALARHGRGSLDLALSFAAERQLPGDAFYGSVLAWKGAIFAAQRSLRRARAADPRNRELVDLLRESSVDLLDLSRVRPAPSGEEDWRRRIARETEYRESLERHLIQRARALAPPAPAAPPTGHGPEEVRQALPAGTALLDFFEYSHTSRPTRGPGLGESERRLAAFVLRPDRPGVARVELGPVAAVALQVERWRGSYGQGRRPLADQPDPGAALRRLVWEPLETQGCLDGVKTVLLSPDGPLTALPFAALPGKQAGSFLLEEWALAVVPVPQVLPDLLASSARDGSARADPSLLLVGDIDFDYRGVPILFDLYGAGERMTKGSLAGPPAVANILGLLASPLGQGPLLTATATATDRWSLKPFANAGTFVEDTLRHARSAADTEEMIKAAKAYARTGPPAVPRNPANARPPGRPASPVPSQPGPGARSDPRGTPHLAGLPPLPGARAEVNSLREDFRRHFPQGEVVLLQRETASREAFTTNAPKYRYLHLATHGFFADDGLGAVRDSRARAGGPRGGLALDQEVTDWHPGLLSGVAFAPTLHNKGLLTALEVADLDLRQVQLVTLSACETGLGKVAGGEGVLGLQRAFQLAGARATVASLWRVDDAATRALMARFYENLWRHKMRPLESLRAAQLWMLRGGEAEPGKPAGERTVPGRTQPGETAWAAPCSWAAFVLSGDWR